MNRIQSLTRRFSETTQSSQIAGAIRGHISRDFTLTALTNALISLSGALGGILAAHLLGPEGRGELAAAVVWAGILTVIASVGLPQALTFSVARNPKAIGSIFRVTLLIWLLQSIAIVALGWITVGMILTHYQPTAVNAVRVYLFSIPLSMLITYLGTMAQGLKRFALFNYLRLLMSVVYPAIFLTATLLRLDRTLEVTSLLLLGQILASLLCFLTFVWRVKPRGSLDTGRISPLLSYGVKSYWGSLSWMANGRLDQFVMSMFIDLGSLGYYAVAVSYATFLFPLAGIFAMVLFPNVAGTLSIAEAKRKISGALKSYLLVSIFGALGFAVLAPWLLPKVFGAQYSPSIYPALVLLTGTVLLGCNYILSDGLRGMGQPIVPSVAEITGALVTVVGLFLLLPLFGIMGAAVTSVLSYGTVTGVLLWKFVGVRIRDVICGKT